MDTIEFYKTSQEKYNDIIKDDNSFYLVGGNRLFLGELELTNPETTQQIRPQAFEFGSYDSNLERPESKAAILRETKTHLICVEPIQHKKGIYIKTEQDIVGRIVVVDIQEDGMEELHFVGSTGTWDPLNWNIGAEDNPKKKFWVQLKRKDGGQLLPEDLTFENFKTNIPQFLRGYDYGSRIEALENNTVKFTSAKPAATPTDRDIYKDNGVYYIGNSRLNTYQYQLNPDLFENRTVGGSTANPSNDKMASRIRTEIFIPNTNKSYQFQVKEGSDIEYRVGLYKGTTFVGMISDPGDWTQRPLALTSSQFTENEADCFRIVFRHKTDPNTDITFEELREDLITNISELYEYTTDELKASKQALAYAQSRIADVQTIDTKLSAFQESTTKSINELLNTPAISSISKVCVFERTGTSTRSGQNDLLDGYMINSDGQIVKQSGVRITGVKYIPQNRAEEKIFIDNFFYYHVTKKDIYAAFYDRNMNVLEYKNEVLDANRQPTGEYIIQKAARMPGGSNKSIDIPENAFFVQFSMTSSTNTVDAEAWVKCQDIVTGDMIRNQNLAINGYHQGTGGVSWTYWTEPKLIYNDYRHMQDNSDTQDDKDYSYHNKQIFAGVVDKEGSAGVTTLNINDETRSKTITVDEVGIDTHDSSGIFFDPRDDKMLCFTFLHSDRNYVNVFKAKRSNDASSFVYLSRIKYPSPVTYTQTFYYNGKFFVFTRTPYNQWHVATSEDLINWITKPVVFAPVQYYIKVVPTTKPGFLRMVMYSNPQAASLSDIRQGFYDLNTETIYKNEMEKMELTTDGRQWWAEASSFPILIPKSDIRMRLLDIAPDTAPNDPRIAWMNGPYIPYGATIEERKDIKYYIYHGGINQEIGDAGSYMWNQMSVPNGVVLTSKGEMAIFSRRDVANHTDTFYKMVYDKKRELYVYETEEDKEGFYHYVATDEITANQVGAPYRYEKYRATYLMLDRESKVLGWLEGFVNDRMYYNWNTKLRCALIDNDNHTIEVIPEQI